MKKYLLALSLSLLSLAVQADNPGLVFHFDFAPYQHQKLALDRTGKFRCESTLPLRIEQNALRIAPEAQILIPTGKLPVLSETLTVSAWILKRSTPDVTPILTRGAHPRFQFNFQLAWRYPVLTYRSGSDHAWHGVYKLGYFGRRIYYPQANWQLPGTALVERSGRWHQLTGVFERGETRLYIDGVLTARRQETNFTKLPAGTGPLIIGAEKIQNESRNFLTSDMLLNDLRLYNTALSSAEIAQIYRQDRPRYPQGNLIPRGATHLNALADCIAYRDPEFDPEFKHKLAQTQKYEQKMGQLPPFQPFNQAAIKLYRGAPLLALDQRWEFPLQFAPVYMYPDGKPRFWEAQQALRDFAAAGVNKFGISISDDPRLGRFWLGEKQYDFTVVDRRLKDAIAANPQALLMLHLFISPPQWFIQKYPQEAEKAMFGQQLRTIDYAGLLNSRRYQAIKNQMLHDLVTHIENSPYGAHVYGYLPGGGQSGEWYWPGGVIGGMPGYGTATQRDFQNYLKKIYHNDLEALRRSWQKPQITFETAQVPTPQERRHAEWGYFRDPGRARSVIDFRRYMSDTTFEHLARTVKTVKQACKNRKVVGVYSGYPFDMTAPKFFNCGLQNAARVMRLAELDFLATPIDYRKRRGGDPGLNTNPFHASAIMHGKIVQHENDIRTYFHNKNESGRPSDLRETLGVIRRGFADALTRGGGLWYYIFDNAWFHQKDIMGEINLLAQLGQVARRQSRASVASIAVIFDEKSPELLAMRRSSFLLDHTENFRRELSRSGVPADFFLLEDFLSSKFPQYRVCIFLNLYSTTPQQRAAIRQKLQAQNITAIWCYAPGIFDDLQLSTAAMTELTGFKFNIDQRRQSVTVNRTAANSALGQTLKSAKRWSVQPVIQLTDPQAKIEAWSGALPVLAQKIAAQRRDIYALTPLNAAFIRSLADDLKIHVYSRSGDIFHASQDFVYIHTVKSGLKTIRLPERSDVYNQSGQRIFQQVKEFQIKLPRHHTEIFRLVK